MAAFVRFWGTRGSIPTPGHSTKRFGGNTSCVEIRFDDTLLVCDGGTGLRELGQDLMMRGREGVVAHMLFSHMHWDHIQGFPFFVPAYDSGTRIHVYEVAPSETHVQRLLHGQMSSEYFPVSFSDLGATIIPGHFEHGRLEIDGVCIRCFEQIHPGRSRAYSFERNGTKLVYATDTELDLVLGNADEVLRNREVLRRLPEELIAFVRDADLLIVDGQYTDDEYATKIGWGHSRSNTAVDLAMQAGVQKCALFHHDPMQTDELVDRKVRLGRERALARGSGLTVFGAREGLELKF